MRGWRLMLAACALAAAGASTAHARALIVGGANAPPGSWPSLVALVKPLPATPSESQFCGGTLVDPSVVLTAGHCVDDGAGGPVSPGTLDVVVGITDLGAMPQTYQRIAISSIKRPPAFNATTIENDVAVLHLATPATLGPTVAVMDLVAPTDRGRWNPGAAAQIAGWGLQTPPTDPNPVLTNALQQANIQIVADSTCLSSTSYGPALFKPTSMVCAGVPAGGVDACNGDSGGPLVVTGLSGAKVLVGATSFTSATNPCGDPNFPAVYARLDALRSFVYGPQGVSGVSPPGEPSAIAATAVPAGASVSWIAPAATHGRAIAGYRVRTRVAGNPTPISSMDIAASKQSVQITGLTCGPSYTFTVTAANAAGLGAESAQSSPIPTDNIPPTNSVPPTVAGVAGLAKTLTASNGQWLSCPGTFTYQWLAERVPGSGSFVPITGHTGAQYVVTPSDVGARLRVRITATNVSGSTSVDSAATDTVPPVPLNLAPPVAAGLGRLGTPLRATVGRWNVADGLTVQWRRETATGSGVFVPIPGATGATYVPTSADVRSRLVVAVTGANASGSVTATSRPITALPRFAVVSTRAPAVVATPAGVARVGLRLQAEPGTRLAIRILDSRGRLRRPIGGASRVAGHAPRVVGRRLIARLGAGTLHVVTVAFRGHGGGALEKVRIVIVATNERGERTVTTVRARVRL